MHSIREDFINIDIFNFRMPPRRKIRKVDKEQTETTPGNSFLLTFSVITVRENALPLLDK